MNPRKRPLLSHIIHRLEAYKVSPSAQDNSLDNKDGKDEKTILKRPQTPKVPASPPAITVLFKAKPPTGEEDYQKGLQFEQQKKIHEAYICYEKAIQYKHIKAFTNAGFCLLTGQGTTQDKAKAYQYFLQAANGKHARGAHNLAKMLEAGDGIPKNLSEALRWYEEALKLGDSSAKSKCETLRKQLVISYQGNLQSAANAK
jgi:tetratricopeptide (TPR) repeat protein